MSTTARIGPPVGSGVANSERNSAAQRCGSTFAITVIAILSACNGSGMTTTTPTRVMSKYAGDGQTVIATLPVPIAPAVRVTLDGVPAAGDTVVFAVADPPYVAGGSIIGAISVTGADGLARVGGWTPGLTGGHLLTATIAGSDIAPATFSATATAYVEVVNAAAGSGQTAHVGTAVAILPRVRVQLDSSGVGLIPLGGATVTFGIGSGGGSITGAVVRTDASGMATVGSWTLGPTAGVNTLTVVVSPFPDVRVTFTATGTP